MTGEQKPIVWYDDISEDWVYRASSLGGCLKMLVAARLNYEGVGPAAWMQKRLDESSGLEDAVMAYLPGEGWETTEGLGTQFHCQLRIDDNTVVRGSMDGLNPETQTVGEAKALGPDLYATSKRFGIDTMKRYQWQSSIYQWGMQYEISPHRPWKLDFVIGHKVDGEIIEAHILHYDEPIISLAEISEKVLLVETIANNSEEMDKLACGVDRSFFCPFPYLHDEELEVNVSDDLAEKIEALSRKYATARETEKLAKLAKDSFGKELNLLLLEHDLSATITKDWRVKVVNGKRGSKLNREKAEKELKVDLSPFVEETIGRPYINVTERKTI